MTPREMTRAGDASAQEGPRYGGCLVLLGVALILGGLFYGILWGLRGAYLGDMSPVKSSTEQRLNTPTPSPSSGAEP
jgi:hypothetical protein